VGSETGRAAKERQPRAGWRVGGVEGGGEQDAGGARSGADGAGNVGIYNGGCKGTRKSVKYPILRF
jgi:hypothetical protein